MKSILFSFFVCCFLFIYQNNINAQSKSTLVKSIVTESASIVFDIPGQIKTSTWNGDQIRVTLTVELTNYSDEILKKLVAVGRYDLKSTLENGIQTITIPKFAQKVSIKGVDLIEKLTVEVLLPASQKQVNK